MKHLLIYFTKDLSFNEYFCSWVNRKLSSKNLTPDTIIKLNNNDSKLNTLLDINYNKYGLITIITDEYSFSTINKILATLKECELILINDEFIVEKYIKYQKDSVLLELNNVSINIIKTNIFEFPEILHNNKTNYDFLIHDEMSNVEILLTTSVKPYNIELSIYPLLSNLLYVKVNTSEYSDEVGFLASIRSLFNKKVIFTNNLYQYIGQVLNLQNQTISFAESCTGGLLASNFTKIDGISSVYKGSLITYSNEYKKAWLNVKDENLDNGMVYSNECAVSMASGVLSLTKSNYAISCTGVLGSDDLGTKSGTVYICAIKDDGKQLCKTLNLKGDRIYMQEQCALECALLLCELEKELFFE
ncbi:CinA family protein [Campylobacter sp. MG1]|uniref:CinA family protein n=1 Tax=Campylobacter sp. MG1 TaxID=2976332 RepID=UPI00226D38DC|nr:CinA family protein [Campylobacter sp. MG1]